MLHHQSVPYYPRRLQHWLTHRLSHVFMRHFWSTIWDLQVSRRISYFMWLLAHGGLPVGEWAARAGHDPICYRCPMRVSETLRHCFWICPHAHFVWRAVCCLLVRIGIHQGFVTWGTVTWLQLSLGSHLVYEGLETDPVFLLTALGYRRGSLDMLSEDIHGVDTQFRDLRFVTVSSITLWVIWKSRCSQVLGMQPSSISDTLREIWSVLLHTLRSQWDASAGSSRAAEERRRRFLRLWARTSVLFSLAGGSITWHYAPPLWFLLHSSHPTP